MITVKEQKKARKALLVKAAKKSSAHRDTMLAWHNMCRDAGRCVACQQLLPSTEAEKNDIKWRIQAKMAALAEQLRSLEETT